MDLSAHPCFNQQARLKFGRVHLPVAAQCNLQCNYCDRRFDCASENRPGVCSALLSPHRAADYLDEVVARDPSVRVVGIAGPGDPLATAPLTLQTLALVRQRHPDLILCLATNGLAAEAHAAALAALAVSHVTVTVNAVDPTIGASIYAWLSSGSEKLRGLAAAGYLWDAQSRGIRALVLRGIQVKVNSVLVPGVNEEHLAEVARAVAALGAIRFNCVPLHPVATTPFEGMREPSPELLRRVRAEAARYLPQTQHCSRCRADAVGRIGHSPLKPRLVVLEKRGSSASEERPYIAVLSREGLLVNQRLGEAARIWVFRRSGDGFVSVEKREAPAPGGGTARWLELARALGDCRALITSGAGPNPRRVLAAAGLEVMETEGLIEDALDAVYQKRALPRSRSERFRCGGGVSCAGDGTACG